jgi:hypothetical protein
VEGEFEKRLARIVDRLRNAPEPPENPRERERRHARERVLTELPRLAARIGATLAEINDGLADAGMALRLLATDRTPLAEAVYTLGVSGAADFQPVLIIIIDVGGRARVMLERDHHRALLLPTTVFELDKERLADVMLTLLEAHADY